MSAERALVQEISTWKFIAEGLTQEHQQSIRADIERRVSNLQQELKELKQQKEDKK